MKYCWLTPTVLYVLVNENLIEAWENGWCYSLIMLPGGTVELRDSDGDIACNKTYCFDMFSRIMKRHFK